MLQLCVDRGSCCCRSEESGHRSRYWMKTCLFWTFLVTFFSFTMSVAGINTQKQLSCTPSILRSRRRQCFIEKPPPVVYAPMGDTVELKCTIGNLKGHVQWIHNVSGFLGAGSSPIQKTYAFSYLGNIRRGQKYLQIRNLSLALQGKYECQVPPKPNLLRFATQVVVLVKPSVPVIYVDGAPMLDNAKVSIRPKAINQEFVCSSIGGNPSPKIQWYRVSKGYPRTSPLRKSMRIKTEGGTRKLASSDILSTTYENRLLLKTRKIRNGDRLVCTISNEATKRHHDSQRKYLMTEVRIELQRPPGRPQIRQSGGERVYFEGDTFVAICTARRGVPSGSLIWRQVLSDNSEGRQFVSYEAGSRELTNRLRIASLTQADHNSRLNCEASNDVTEDALRATLTLRVNFAPRTVTIYSEPKAEKIQRLPGGRRELVVYGRAGYSKTLSCRTDLFYPSANITWLRGSERITPQSDRIIPRPGGFLLESNISVTFTREDNNRYYDCRAYGVKGGRADSRVKLSIMYPPGRPYLAGHTSNKPLAVGRKITIKCVSIGGSPQPDLFWYKAATGERVEAGPLKTVGNQRTRDFTITLSRQDNGDEYVCVAISPAMSPGKELRSPKYRVQVRFPPESVSISMVGKPWSTDGDTAVVLCKAASSNPGAVIRWKQIRCLKKGRCTTSSLEAYKVESYPGRFAGTETHSQVRLRTTWRDHGTFIECEAFNPKLGAPTLNDRVTLNVTYAPKFKPFGDGLGNGEYASRAVREASNMTLEMGAVANPPPTHFNWLFGDQVFRGNARIFPVRGKLVLRGVKRSDAGNYTLLVANPQGNAQLKFFLNVTYPPTLIGPSRVNISATGNHAQLECSALANPPLSTGFVWRRVDVLGGLSPPRLTVRCNQGEWNERYKYFAKCRRPTSLSASAPESVRDRFAAQHRVVSSLIIYNIQARDVGYYQCIVRNGVGKPAVKTFEVIVPFKPIMMNKPRYTKAAGELGGTVSLRCRAEGEPKISFSWFRGPDNLTLIAAEKYRMKSKRLRPGLYETSLRIHNLQKSDHGTYFCQGSNAVGTSTLKLRVSGTGAPDIPSHLNSINATDRSVLIRWSQGFNGGSPQTFTVRWREVGVRLYQYRDVASIPSEEYVEYVIDGLKSGKKYEISVNARNKPHGSSPYCRSILTSTKLLPAALGPVDRSHGKGSLEDDMPVLIIVAACVFAFIVLVINIVVVAFILRRRGHCGGPMRFGRKERVTQNGKGVLYLKTGSTDAYELRSSHGGDGSYRRGSLQGDDDKTYSSYDATSDEVRDLIKKYPNEMFVPHNAYVDLLYPANAYRHPSLAPIGETQLMGQRCALPPGTMIAATMEQPTLMARPSPMARTSPSSLSANSHERVPTTFQPIVLLNQHANNPELAMPNYPPNPGTASADILTNGYRSGSLTTFPPVPLAQAEAQQRHSYAEELRRVQYNAALAAGMQPNCNNLSASKPMSGPNSNSSTLNSRHLSGPIDPNVPSGPTTAFGAVPSSSRGDSPTNRQTPATPTSATGNSTSVSSADTVIRYTPNGGAGNATSCLLRPGNDYMV